MIAQHEYWQSTQLLEHLPKVFVCRPFAPMREVPHHDRARNVAMIAIDRTNRGGKTGGRIEAVEHLPRGHEVCVRQNDKIHCCTVRDHLFGNSACTSAAISANTLSGSPARLPSMIDCRRSFITSVILRPFSPGKAYQLAM